MRIRGNRMNKLEVEEMETGKEILMAASLKGKIGTTTRGKGTPRRLETHTSILIGEIVPLTSLARNVERSILVNVVKVPPIVVYMVKKDISSMDAL